MHPTVQAKVMNKYPIVFRFRDIVAGNGFLAHVILDGRALLVVEDDGDHWVNGVQPGAVAGGAADSSTALNEFKARYQSVLFDIAGDVKTFDDFKRGVEEFFAGVSAEDEAEWNEALEAVRRSNASLDDLPTVKAETVPSRIGIIDIKIPQPAMNELDHVAAAA